MFLHKKKIPQRGEKTSYRVGNICNKKQWKKGESLTESMTSKREWDSGFFGCKSRTLQKKPKWLLNMWQLLIFISLSSGNILEAH